MGAGLSSKESVVLRDDTTSFGEPSASGDGVDLQELKSGAYLPDRAVVLLRKGDSAPAGNVTLTGPVYVDLLIRDAWYKSGALNGGNDIVLGDAGWAERIEDVGVATRATVHAASDPANEVTAELAFIDDDDE
jgi:hypothetical protein